MKTKIPKVEKSELPFDWNNTFWKGIKALTLDSHRKESLQQPTVVVKVCHTKSEIILFWKVKEDEIVCKHKNHFDKVYEDSCVEFFVKPFNAVGYFNFEINCNSKILSYYITDWVRNESGKLKEFKRLPISDLEEINISSKIYYDDNEWFLLTQIPKLILLNNSELNELNFTNPWKANFYKCADKSSKPHWSSWNPVSELNFHQPNDFGEITFE